MKSAMVKRSSRLNGWRAMAMACAAVLTPSVVFAADSNVAIVNPNTGTPATVDSLGELHTLDYADNHNITIEFPMFIAVGCDTASYTLPAGKALIITSMSGDYYNSDGASVVGLEVFSEASCNGSPYIKHFVPMPATVGAVADINYTYGNGIAIPNGTISVYSIGNTGLLQIHGYLVPANWVSTNEFHEAGTGGAPGIQPGHHGPSAR